MLTFKQKVSYGIGRLGSSITMDLADLFTGYVYFAFFGLEEDPFLAFLGVAIGKLVIAFSSYFSGYVSDRTNTRWGRRRPFVIVGAPLLAITFFLLYSPHLFLPATSDSMTIFTYLLVMNALYQALYGFLLTPFQSWMPEITIEEERLEISGYQNTVNLIAFVIGAGSAFLLPALIGGEAEEVILSESNVFIPFLTNGLIITVLIGIFALMVIIFFIPSLITIRAKEVFIPQPSILEELRLVFSNQNYIWWTISRGFLSVALSLIMGIVLSWIDVALNFGTVEYLLFGLTLLGIMFIGFIFWGKFGNKYGKTKSFIYAMLWTVIWMPLTLFLGQIEFITQIIPVLIQAIIFCILVAIGLSGFYLLPYAIVADIAEEDERRTGESRAGMYYGFESIPLNFFQFFGYLIVGFLLDNLPDYTNWQENVFSLGFLVWGPVSMVFVLISVIIFWKFVNADPLQDS
ncbi:MAG: MFS transporter [Candidatus Hodarchaeota archaeon]